MKPMELFRSAIAEIGDASAAELSVHVENKHGVKIEPAFIPVFKATLKENGTDQQNSPGRKAHSTERTGAGDVNQSTS